MLVEIEDMRRDLKYRLAETHRWDGQLRRQLRARAIQGSNSIEGYHASVEDIESIMSGEDPLEASGQVAREIAGYQQALTYIQLLSRAPVFRYDIGLLNALNFMMIGHHRDKTPGVVRPGGIYVRSAATGEVVYEGPDVEEVPGLLDELADWLNSGDLDAPSYVRAAMSHFNLVAIHPWRDGNGRMSRALQTLVLGRDQILTPEFSSIEEWLGTGENTTDYYRALREVQHGAWGAARRHPLLGAVLPACPPHAGPARPSAAHPGRGDLDAARRAGRRRRAQHPLRVRALRGVRQPQAAQEPLPGRRRAQPGSGRPRPAGAGR
ncbi:Fic family protein [Nonomuraea ferruginea]